MTGIEDLHGGHGMAENEANGTGFGLMEENQEMMGGDDDLLGVSTDPSMFFAEFPTLPDFTCMSSSSSSSSPPQPGEFAAHTCSTSSATSSSASSWVVLKSEAESYHHLKGQQRARLEAQAAASSAALHSTPSMEVGHQHQHQAVDGQQACMVENFGYMDLLDSNDLFDLSMILNSETPGDGGSEQDQHITPQEFLQQNLQQGQGDGRSPSIKDNTRRAGEVGGGIRVLPHDDMSQVFFEWLKSNKGAVSAEDLRKVKIKRATIESAARRLGGGREAMKQLLKLILEWVQSNVLKKRTRGGAPQEGSQQLQYKSQEPPCVTNTNMNSLNSVQPDSTLCFPQSQWTLQAPYASDTPATMAPAQTIFQPVGCAGNDPYSNGNSYQQPADYQMQDSGQIWPGSQFGLASNYNSFPDNNFNPVPPTTPQAYSGFGSQYPFAQYGENGLLRLGSSATKEARKKRMARQRRMMSHHRHHNQQNQQPNLPLEQRGLLGSDNCTAIPPQANQGNWIYWQPVPGGGATAPGIIPMDTAQARQATQNYQWQVVTPERKQGWKSEKNLKFLLQKVLKQSDVGSLGRIVLPKKEAEAHLPELDARDGINIAMEDVGTSRVWNMRYRFWPNNKSRMYLLENTSEFVRANGLQEGDFIVIYSDLKCGKYMIRGVKVRPPVKTENKRAGKAQKTLNISSPAGELSSAITQNQ